MTTLQLFSAVQEVIRQHLGLDVDIVGSQQVTGGCIHATHIVESRCGQRWFVKSSNDSTGRPFFREAEGLGLLAKTPLRVPSVIAVDTIPDFGSLLILEVIEPGRPRDGFSERFGRQLAEMHRQLTADQFGWDQPNFLGHTVQPNDWHSDWGIFWQEQRLGYQLRIAHDNGYADRQMQKLGDRLLSRISELVATDESPSLIHGDLWSGNFLVESTGEPVLIDPAVYYADRLAEFGMTTLFGGFGSGFYSAYREAWPWPSGAEIRIELYRLYHLLNHLNLFGTSYRNSCIEILRKYA